MTYLSYDPDTGRPVRWSSTRPADGAFVIETELTRFEGLVVRGGVLVPEDRDPDAVLQAAWAALRAERDRRLAASDWTQLPDAAVPRAPWSAYRRALRAMPETTTDPTAPVWPAPPTEETPS